MRRVLHTPEQRTDWVSHLYMQALPVTVSVVEGGNRSLDQNALLAAWVTEVSHQTGEGLDEVRARTKLDIGTIILCRDDPDFLAFCKRAMGDMGREDRLKAMKWVPVTRLMTVKQMTEFLNEFEKMHRAQGLVLSVKEGRLENST